jgi:hypothetical protein
VDGVYSDIAEAEENKNLEKGFGRIIHEFSKSPLYSVEAD